LFIRLGPGATFTGGCVAQLSTQLLLRGGETDVCVLATILGAIDWAFRVILVTDALCSSADETHNAMMNVYMNRFGEQVECATTDTLLESWPGSIFATLPIIWRIFRHRRCRSSSNSQAPCSSRPSLAGGERRCRGGAGAAASSGMVVETGRERPNLLCTLPIDAVAA
jgi:hypothetical protein